MIERISHMDNVYARKQAESNLLEIEDRQLGNAIFILGFSEDKGFGEAFEGELKKRGYSDATTFTAGDIVANPGKLNNLMAESSVFTHSFGTVVAIDWIRTEQTAPKSFTALNPVEKSPFMRTVNNARKVLFQPNNLPEDGIKIPGPLRAPIELAKHPVTGYRIPVTRVPRSDSAKNLILLNNSGAFSEGAAYFSFLNDEFEFTDAKIHIPILRANGVHADVLYGTHNAPMYRPKMTYDNIERSVGQYYYVRNADTDPSHIRGEDLAITRALAA